MRILIVADIEGISGVAHPEQTRPGTQEYERARLLMTREVNAAAQGALNGNAAEVWVADSHGSFRNILFENLHPEVRLISGRPRLNGMMAGLEEHGPWHGIFLIGCHARAGSSGVLAHTINNGAFALITVDGKAVGEAFINSALAGEHEVPVRLVSGDDCLAREVGTFLPGAEIVTVKQALGARSATHLPLNTVHEALITAAEHAMQREVSPHRLTEPLWIEVTTVQPVQADLFAVVPGVQRLHATAVGFEADNMSLAARMLNTFSAMAASL